ncbi:unnamed protein product [Strongylus vulgaris]|uniref:Carboxypeptidase n=1 Tax=Strongylus vulgaris TaxID=40348 RepID=A0A3P7JWZ8_STRVU|nr:unnamed protein product [Strongylus vulgaris]
MTEEFLRYRAQIAGYVKQFSYGSVSIDLLTVKGAGHLVPSDRPGPALQMFENFLRGQDYSKELPFSYQLHPLRKEYQIQETVTAEKINAPVLNDGSASALKLKSRRMAKNNTKEADLVKEGVLPGLTWALNFAHYSGYLAASPGNYLHYWLTESQNSPANDPLILWLNGGPGCSSLGGLFEELGPFHVNSDGKTLFENVFSWNKVGNVLFMEAPRDVGFSYRSSDVKPDSSYNDDYVWDSKTTIRINRESYGGVYVPTLTRALIKKIQSLFSDFDALSQCCNSTTPQTYCDFVSYITLDVAGNAWPKVNDNSLNGQCGRMVVQQGFNDVWETANDVYNTFQDCYTTASDGTRSRRKRSADMPPLMNTKPFVDQAKKINYQSTDANSGFSCFNGDATEAYLNIQAVRDAIHIPAGVPYWTDCKYVRLT